MLPQRRLSHAQGYLALGMIAEAEAELAQIPSPFADSTAVIAVRLAVRHEQSDWPAVRDLAADLVKRGRDDAGVWVTWAYAARRADTLAAAEAILLEAEKRYTREAIIHFNLGCYACVRGELKLARRRVAQAIALDKAFAKLAVTDPDLTALRAEPPATDCQPGT